MSSSSLTLNKNREITIKRFHPWIFSGAVKRSTKDLIEGSIVKIYSIDNEELGTGFYGTKSISAKVLFFGKTNLTPEKIILNNLEQSLKYRKELRIFDQDLTNSFRIVNAEGDLLPGLVIDLYNKTAVIETQNQGITPFLETIKAYLLNNTLIKIDTIFIKNNEINTSQQETVILENKRKFVVNYATGQKTGFFLDQRENREKLGLYARDKTVLNLFSYTGGFSIYALLNGASKVTSVDSSKPALELLERNLALNNIAKEKHQNSCQDVFDFLNEDKTLYDLVIVDPPAFAKHLRSRDSALRAYEKLFGLAAKRVKEGGIIAGFTCSGVVTRSEFEQVFTRGISGGKRVGRVLERLSQAPCHTQLSSHPEGEYLKGMIARV